MNINKIAKFGLSIVFVVFQFSASAQIKTIKVRPISAGEKGVSKSQVLKIIGHLGNQDFTPLSFVWQINADTILAPKTVFREVIDVNSWSDGASDMTPTIDGTITITRSYRDDTINLKKSDRKDYNVSMAVGEHYIETSFCYFTVKDDILIFEDKDTKKKERFKLYLDKKKTKIIRIQNLTTKNFYEPAEFEGAPPSIGL